MEIQGSQLQKSKYPPTGAQFNLFYTIIFFCDVLKKKKKITKQVKAGSNGMTQINNHNIDYPSWLWKHFA